MLKRFYGLLDWSARTSHLALSAPQPEDRTGFEVARDVEKDGKGREKTGKDGKRMRKDGKKMKKDDKRGKYSNYLSIQYRYSGGFRQIG